MFDTLTNIGADTVPALLVFNKCDTPAARERVPGLLARYPGAMAVSALQHEGLTELKQKMAEMIDGKGKDEL